MDLTPTASPRRPKIWWKTYIDFSNFSLKDVSVFLQMIFYESLFCCDVCIEWFKKLIFFFFLTQNTLKEAGVNHQWHSCQKHIPRTYKVSSQRNSLIENSMKLKTISPHFNWDHFYFDIMHLFWPTTFLNVPFLVCVPRMVFLPFNILMTV